MTAYFLTEKAEQDLIDFYLDGYDKWGEAQADAYAHRLHDVLNALPGNPIWARYGLIWPRVCAVSPTALI